MKDIISNTKEISINDEKALLAGVPGGVGIFEIKGTSLIMKYINDAYYDMLGTSRNERLQYEGIHSIDIVHPDDVHKIREAVERVAGGESQTSVVYRAQNAVNEWFWINLTASVVERQEDNIKLYVTLCDFNEVMHKQHEVETNRTMLRSAMEIANIVTWKYNYKTDCITDTSTMGEFFGLPKVIKNARSWFIENGLVHEDSIQNFIDMFDRMSAEQTVSAEIRRVEDGSNGQIWHKIIYTPTFDSQGEYTDSIGVALDITEQKNREQEYIEELNLSKVANQNAIAIARYNFSRNIVIDYSTSDSDFQYLFKYKRADDMLRSTKDTIFDPEERRKFDVIADSKTVIEAFRNGCKHIEIQHHLMNYMSWYRTSFDIIENPYTGDVEAISYLHDVTDEVRSNLIMNQLLSTDYQSVLLINMITGEVAPCDNCKEDLILLEAMALQEEKGSGSKGLEALLNEYCIPGMAEQAIKENSIEYIVERLEEAPYYECMYSLNMNGNIGHYRILYCYLQEDKNILMSAVQNVTDLYELQNRQKEELKQALAKANDANKAKMAFLSRMSHEIRTPINAIMGLAELEHQDIKSGNFNNFRFLDYTNDIYKSSEYLLSLVNDVLDTAKIDSGKLELYPYPVDVKSFLETIRTLAKPLADARAVNLHIERKTYLHDSYMGDGVRVQQVLMNLLSNAVKFTSPGGCVKLSAEAVRDNGSQTELRFIVEDNGIGMSPEFQAHLFDEFTQESTSNTASTSGSGLGLSIARKLVRLMGGDIICESKQGVGSKFIINVTVYNVTSVNASCGKQAVEQVDLDCNFQGMHVLLCEDHPLNQKITSKLLERKNCKVDIADDGIIGVNMFKQSQVGYYAAVIMDIRMPNLDGIDAARQIRSMNRDDALKVPIIAMSANAFEEDIAQSLAAGMNEHLPKPVNGQILINSLARHTKRDVSAVPISKDKILVVDDVEANRVVIGLTLEKEYEVVYAGNGLEALQILENCSDIIAVITDIQMPEMNGAELIKEIRKVIRYDGIAILANTQFGDVSQERILLNLGADDFIYKSVDLEVVVTRLKNVIAKRKQIV